MRLSRLIERLQQLTRQQIAVETEIADIQRQILEAGEIARPKRGRPRGTSQGVPDGVEAVVKTLKELGGPLGRREIAELLGVSGSTAGFRLAKAVKLGFATKVAHGRYVIADATKAALD